LIYNECEINSDLSLIQNVDHDEDMSGERGCFFKDGKRRIGMSMPTYKLLTLLMQANTTKNFNREGKVLTTRILPYSLKAIYKWMSNVSCVKL